MGLVTEVTEQGVQGNEVAVAPEAGYHANTHRREHRLMPERFTGVDVREVRFDDWK
jgi:hypothetical protein